jgi:hypothetical protein
MPNPEKKARTKIKLINKSLDFLERKTEDIGGKFDKLQDCFSTPCVVEKDRLEQEMSTYINKIKLEGEELDRCEREYYFTYSGQAI